MLLCMVMGGSMTLSDENMKTIEQVPASEWEKLSKHTIYFGHLSVMQPTLSCIRMNIY